MDIVFDLYKQDLTTYILNINKEERRKILKDYKFREHLFKEENHHAFIWLIYDLSYEDLPYLLDDEIIPRITNDAKVEDKLNVIMSEPKTAFFQKNNLVLNEIMKYQIYKHHIIEDIGIANKMLKYAVEHGQESVIGHFDKDVQNKIFNDSNNYDIIAKLNKRFFVYLNPDIVEDLFKNNFYINLVNNLDYNNLKLLFTNVSYLPSNLLTNKMSNVYLAIEDINEFRFCVNNIKNNYLKELIEKNRKQQYIEKFANIENGLLPEYNDIYNKIKNNQEFNWSIYKYSLYYKLDKDQDNTYQILKEESIKNMLEMTIDMAFKDVTYNFLKNIEQMINYLDNNPNLIPQERLNIYKNLDNYYELNDKERIELFNRLKNMENSTELFYDDYQTCKISSYQDICTNNLANIKETNLSNIFNIPIYELNGEEFNVLITKTKFSRNNNDSINQRMWDKPGATVSLSLISNNNLQTYKSHLDNVILGFNVNPKNIMHVFETDSYTSRLDSSKRVQRIMSKEELIKKTKGYNEIQVVNKNYEGNATIFPSYVIAYDGIKEGDLVYAKKYNLPIIIVNTYKYENKTSIFNFDGDKYLSSSELSEIKDYRKHR